MTKIYQQETKAHANDPVVQKHLKQIKRNKILWLVGSIAGLILTIVMVVISMLFYKNNGRIMGIAIGIPAVITALVITMTIFIWIGNEIGVKTYKNDKITFYSGPWSNALYINDQLIYKGSSETKMVGTLGDGSLCKIIMKTTSFTINILPPGSDPVTGAPKKKDEKKMVIPEPPKSETK